MSFVIRAFVALTLVASSFLTGCDGVPIALPTPTTANPPSATPATPAPDSPDAPDAPATPAPAATPSPTDTRVNPPWSPEPGIEPGSGVEPGAGAAPGAGVEPGVEPGAAPGATEPPPLYTLTVTPDGLGPLRLGAPVPDQGSPTAMAVWDPDYCQEFPHPVGGSTGAFHANYPHTVSPALGSSAPFTLATTHGESDGTIASLIVFSPEVETTVGLGVGSTRSELTSAYLGFDEQWSGPLSDVYALNGANGRLVFEVAKRPHAPLSDYWSDDVLDTVLWMIVVPVGAPAPAIAASDAGGPCAI